MEKVKMWSLYKLTWSDGHAFVCASGYGDATLFLKTCYDPKETSIKIEYMGETGMEYGSVSIHMDSGLIQICKAEDVLECLRRIKKMREEQEKDCPWG